MNGARILLRHAFHRAALVASRHSRRSERAARLLVAAGRRFEGGHARDRGNVLPQRRQRGIEAHAAGSDRRRDRDAAEPLAVALARKGEWPDDRKLAPGESLFVEYELELPKEVSGRVLLEVKRFATAATVIEIETVEKPARLPSRRRARTKTAPAIRRL